MRPTRSRCWAGRGEHPAGPDRGDHRRLRRRAADRGAAARRGAAPPAARPHPAGRDAAHPGRSPARAPDPGPRRADRPARSRPGPARRDRGLEDRPAPAHLPADRAHLRPGRRRAGQGRPRRPALADILAAICDDLLEASIPEEHKHASTALAVDWTDVETFSRPPPRGTSDCADPEASWGHRSGGGPGQDSELFFGYYPSAGTMMREEHGPPVPELARRMTVSLLPHDPARALVPVLTAHAREPASRSATSWPTPATPTATPSAWAIPLRPAGAQLVQDLHPSDRGPQRHPPRRHHRQRQPLLPAPPRPLLGTRPAGPRRHPRAGRRARPAVRRAGPAQAREDHRRRRRRLPPGHVPRGHGQDPLPARARHP